MSEQWSKIVPFDVGTERPTVEYAEALKAELAALKRDYNELIMAVANKHEGETRHQTALRYILEAEQGSSEASMEASHE